MSGKFTYTTHHSVKYQGRTHPTESQDVIAKRGSIASNLIHEGCTYKHAWWQAFQQVPRVYDDELDPTPATSTDLSTPSNFVFPSRVGESTCGHESGSN